MSFLAVCKIFAEEFINSRVVNNFLGYFCIQMFTNVNIAIDFFYNGGALTAENLTI